MSDTIFKTPSIWGINNDEFQHLKINNKLHHKHLKLIDEMLQFMYNMYESLDGDYISIYSFHCAIVKNLLLASLSTLRMQNGLETLLMRHALEYLRIFVYAVNEPNLKTFKDKFTNNPLDIHKLLEIATDWFLKSKYKNKFDDLKELNEYINTTSAHANFIHSILPINYDKNSLTMKVNFFNSIDPGMFEMELVALSEIILKFIVAIEHIVKEFPEIRLKKSFDSNLKSFKHRFDKLENETKTKHSKVLSELEQIFIKYSNKYSDINKK